MQISRLPFRPETEQGTPNGTTPREKNNFSLESASRAITRASYAAPVENYLERTNFRELFLGCMQKLSTNVYWTFARKTFVPKHCIHTFHPVPNIFIWVVHGNVFSGSCFPYSWHRNFFNLKTKEKAQGSFSSFCCRVTPHNYANNSLPDRVSPAKKNLTVTWFLLYEWPINLGEIVIEWERSVKEA